MGTPEDEHAAREGAAEEMEQNTDETIAPAPVPVKPDPGLEAHAAYSALLREANRLDLTGDRPGAIAKARAYADQMERWEVGSQQKHPRAISLSDFLAIEFPPREYLLAPILQTQGLAMIHAWRGVGKTFFALEVAYAVASGGAFLKWTADRPRGVLYLDGEMAGPVMQERLAAIIRAADMEVSPDYFRLLTPDLQEPGGVPDLSTPEGQAAVDSLVTPETALIVVDNISCFVRHGKENEGESWQPVQSWALRQRAAGRSVLFVHHSGKGGTQRGASKREDILDLVLCLDRPPDYDPREGAKFEVRVEKGRHLAGEDAAPFEVKLEAAPGGGRVWTWQPLEDSTLDRVVALYGDGLSQAEIAAELDVNRSTVSRALKKAAGLGRIPSHNQGRPS